MAQVIDNDASWLGVIPQGGITDAQITVTMAGENGLNAVCTGNVRAGMVVDNAQNAYSVKLPGAFTGLDVTFNRIL